MLEIEFMEKRMESGDLNNLENNDVEDGFESDFVLSICWDAMILSAAYFDLTLLELHVSKVSLQFFSSNLISFIVFFLRSSMKQQI